MASLKKEKTSPLVPLNIHRKCAGLIRQNLLVALTLFGVGVGFTVGFTLVGSRPSANCAMWIGMAGELYIQMLKLMIVPLVVCSVITGTANMDPKSNGKVSAIALGYTVINNGIGAIIGTTVCMIVKPGQGLNIHSTLGLQREIMEPEDIFADLFRNLIPDNIVAANFRQAQTQYDLAMKSVATGNGTANVTEVVRKYVGFVESTNVLGLIVVCSVFGITAATMEGQADAFLAFFRASGDVIMKVLRILMWSTPVGVASLIAKSLASLQDVAEEFHSLALYIMAVFIGLLLWGLVMIPLLFFTVRRTNPFRFLWTIVPPMTIVFATGSAMVAVPESLISLEEKNGVDSRISRFVAPLTATIGRSGSAIYIASSCIFIIQTLGEVNTADIILVTFLTWISSLAIPSVPGSGLMTVLMLLTALNIPGEAAAMLFVLEFVLDRSRSVVSNIDQLVCAMVTDKLCAATLRYAHHTHDKNLADRTLQPLTEQEIIVEPPDTT